MKINYNNTALGLLDKCTPTSFRISAEQENTPQAYITALGMDIVHKWPTVAPMFKEKIRYLTEPFYNAYEKALPKLSSLLDTEELAETGTFIHKPSNREANTVFYALTTSGKDKDFKIYGFVFIFNSNTDKDKPSLAIYVQRNNNGIKEHLSKRARDNGCTNLTVFADVLTLILFLKYCELETKLVKAGKKEFHVGQKYLNDTKSNVEILDSTWFTTIVRSEGFTVGAESGGFWRLQACGKDNADRKLKWILPFEKTGYTRKAKILTNDTN